jgi:hypothetical protein
MILDLAATSGINVAIFPSAISGELVRSVEIPCFDSKLR